MTGKVKTLTDKGFGFISMGKGEKDMFFHANALNGIRYDELKEGDELEFDIEQGDKGAHAVNIDWAQPEASGSGE